MRLSVDSASRCPDCRARAEPYLKEELRKAKADAALRTDAKAARIPLLS
jgi:hypothetical protein